MWIFALLRVMAVCFTESGKLLSGGQDKALRMWDVVGRYCMKTIHKRPGEITAIVKLNR